MLKLVRFRWDIQAPGRYFSAGTVLRVMVDANSAIIPPIPEIGVSLVTVPVAALEAVTAYSATVFNAKHCVEGECEIVGIDEDEACYLFHKSAPDCRILHLKKLRD
jgi:hypothetical protein